MFKLIAADLDGTLLTPDRLISPYTASVLQQACEKGATFIICTGRMYDSIRTFLPLMPFCRYAITCMGAEIYDNFSRKRILHRPLKEEYTMALAEYALAKNVHMNIYIDDVLYTNSMDKYAQRYLEETTSASHLIEGDVLRFLKGKELSKLVYIGEEDDIAQHFRAVEQMLGGKVNICASSRRYVECSALEAQKDIVLNELTERLGHSKNELIVFGDSGNDVSMLSNTGFSCCVANGWEQARRAAHIIVESNACDGVARTVKRLVLKEEV